MSIFDGNYSIIVQKRQGTAGDPFVPITEPVKISGGIGVLREIPARSGGMTVTNGGTSLSINDATLGQLPTPTIVSVQWDQCYIYADPSLEGATLNVSYSGSGNIFISSNRIFTKNSGNTVTQTLNDLTNAASQFLYVGDYSGSVSYNQFNIVNYQGSAYIYTSTTSTSGNLPTNSTYWGRISGTSSKGQYSNAVSYNSGDTVFDSNNYNLYQSLVNNNLNNPLSDNTKWEVLISVQTIVDTLNTTNTNVTNAESARVTAEDNRVTAENARVSAESTRTSNETARQTAETNRATAETGRVNAESSRVTAENSRVSAESSRVTAENTRASNESTRQSNETSRQTAETNRASAESSRVTAENNRVSAESSRATAETNRASAESSRVSAENARASAESTRSTNETTRQNNEATRQSNETTRINNENARGWKGDYSGTATYIVNNQVTFSNSTYICIQNTTAGIDPTNASYWSLYAAAGSVGSVNSANSDISISNPTTAPVLTLNSSIAATPNAIVKRDPQGYISGVTDNPTPTPVSLANGQQILTTTKAGLLQNFNAQGRSLVNLTGELGNFEKIGKNSVSGVSEVLDSTNVKIGLNSIKLTATGSTSVEHYSELGSVPGTNYLSIPASSYFIAVGWIKPNVGQARLRVVTYNSSDTVVQDLNPATGLISDTTKFSVAWGKFSTGSTEVLMTVRAQVTDSSGTNVFTQAGENANFDGFRVYQITQAQYNALGSTLTDPNAIDAMYPYVDDVKHLSGLYMIRYGENLLPPFNEWTLHANAIVTSPYSMTLNATALNQDNYVDVPIASGQTYTLSASRNDQTMQVEYATSISPWIYASVQNQGSPSSGTTMTFTPPADAKYARVHCYNANTANGSFVFTDLRLNIGTADLGFQPRNDDMMAFPVPIASSFDQSVTDLIYHDGQKYVKESRFKDMVLDGSLAWVYQGTVTGYKIVAIVLSNAVDRTQTVVKYDGKILGSVESISGSDQGQLVTGNNTLYISISSADSGWGDSITPTADEIKAYVAYGWKMFDGVDASQPYNGTGTKTWINLSEYGVSSSNNTTTCPTTYGSVRNGAKWQPYKLTYQLATPTYDDLTGVMEGEINLLEGANQIEVGAGMILREKASPQFSGSDSLYHINNSNVGGSNLRNRTSRFVGLYKNGKLEPSWTTFQNASGQGADLRASSSIFDPTATYEVTYKVLDQYLLTSSPVTITGEYDTNIKTVQDRASQTLADYGERLSVAEMLAARTYRKPDMSVQDMTYYVDGTNGSDSGDGSAAKPFKTIGKFTSMYSGTVVTHTISVNVAAGTYNEDVFTYGTVGAGVINFVANGTVNINSFNAQACNHVTVNGFTATTTSNQSFTASNGGGSIDFISCSATTTDLGHFGFYILNQRAYIAGCTISNKASAIYADRAEILVGSCSGSGNTNVLSSSGGNIRTSGTLPTGTNTYDSSTVGVINPWGDNTLANRSAATVGNNAIQSLSANVATKVVFQTVYRDSLGEFSTANNRFIAKHGGLYDISGYLTFNGLTANTTNITIGVTVNGTSTNNMYSDSISSSTGPSINFNHKYVVNAGDYIELYVTITTAGGISASSVVNFVQEA